MNPHLRTVLIFIVLPFAIAFGGCGFGSTKSFNGTTATTGTTPTASSTTGSPGSPSGTPGSGGSGGTGAGGSTLASIDQLAACGTTNNSGAVITGHIIDAVTGQAIVGQAFAIVDYNPQGQWVNVITAGPDGSFGTAKLYIQQTSFTLTFWAISSSGTQYVPKILVPTASCPITQGTEIGTIALSPGTSATGTALITGQTASGGPASISEIPMGLFTGYAGINWEFALYPYLAQRQNLNTGGECPQNTSCLSISFGVPASTPLGAMYAGSVTQFQPAETAATWVFADRWNGGLDSAISYNCVPVEAHSQPQTATAGATVNFGTLAFGGC